VEKASTERRQRTLLRTSVCYMQNDFNCYIRSRFEINIHFITPCVFSLFIHPRDSRLPQIERFSYRNPFSSSTAHRFFCSHTLTALTRSYFPYCTTYFSLQKGGWSLYFASLTFLRATLLRLVMHVFWKEARKNYIDRKHEFPTFRCPSAPSAKVTIYIQFQVKRPISATGSHLRAVAIFSRICTFANVLP